jgi:hypothetical protein
MSAHGFCLLVRKKLLRVLSFGVGREEKAIISVSHPIKVFALGPDRSESRRQNISGWETGVNSITQTILFPGKKRQNFAKKRRLQAIKTSVRGRIPNSP